MNNSKCIGSLEPSEINLWVCFLLWVLVVGLWSWRFVSEWVGNAHTVGKLVIIRGLALLKEGIVILILILILLVGWSSLGCSLICLPQLLFPWRKALAWIACHLHHPHLPPHHLLGFRPTKILKNSLMVTSLMAYLPETKKERKVSSYIHFFSFLFPCKSNISVFFVVHWSFFKVLSTTFL